MRPLGEGGRWMYFIRLEQTDGSWRYSWQEASRNNNPAEIAAQHLHCCVQFTAQAGGSCDFGSINKEERSISKTGFTSTAFLEGISFRWVWRKQFSRSLLSLGTDITVALTASTVTPRHILPVSTDMLMSAGDLALYLEEIQPVQLVKSQKY